MSQQVSEQPPTIFSYDGFPFSRLDVRTLCSYEAIKQTKLVLTKQRQNSFFSTSDWLIELRSEMFRSVEAANHKIKSTSLVSQASQSFTALTPTQFFVGHHLAVVLMTWIETIEKSSFYRLPRSVRLQRGNYQLSWGPAYAAVVIRDVKRETKKLDLQWSFIFWVIFSFRSRTFRVAFRDTSREWFSRISNCH